MTDGKTKEVSNREVKSDVFTSYFSVPKNAAQLYAALSGVPVVPEDIEIRTLEGVLFLARKNDLGFTVKDRTLVISEHQSTLNINMPLRSILYYGRTMEKLLHTHNLYKNKPIRIPAPEFYVFYNGESTVPAEKILKLSDAYIEKQEPPMLELIVKVIDINYHAGHGILQKCEPLYEYSWFIHRIRYHIGCGLTRDAAITQAVNDCLQEKIFADFVSEHGAEVVNMLFTQFNLEDAKKVWYEEGVEDGYEKGVEQGRGQGISVGKEEGERSLLVRQACLKLQKGKSAKIIAEELEAPEELIERICEAYRQFGADEKAVCRRLSEEDHRD